MTSQRPFAPRSPHAVWKAGLLTAMTCLAACSANVAQSPMATSALPGQPAAATNQSVQQKPVRIGMLLPLGGFGQSAQIAKAMKQAGELALFEINNPMVQLIVKDDRGTAEGARTAAQEAISAGAEIVLGPLFSAAVPGAAGVTRSANVPLISFSNDRNVAGQGVYLMSFQAEPEVERIVAYAARQGKRRFAALIPADDYGRVVEPVFRQAVQRAGGTVVDVESYPLEASGMLRPVKQLVAKLKSEEGAGQPVDAIYIPGGRESLPHLGPLIAYSGIDTSRVKLLGSGAWDYPGLGREKVFVGGWYPSPEPGGFQDFSGRFTRTFGSPPPRVASLAYDAVVAAISLSANPPGLRFTPQNITRPSGFAGVDGVVRFTAGGVSERGLAVLEVQPFTASVIEPAPSADPGLLVEAGPSAFQR